jgi:hypothetical protein
MKLSIKTEKLAKEGRSAEAKRKKEEIKSRFFTLLPSAQSCLPQRRE